MGRTHIFRWQQDSALTLQIFTNIKMFRNIILTFFVFCILEHSLAQPTTHEDFCSDMPCGAVCDTTDGFDQVMRYCQPDGSCSSNAQPDCIDSNETRNTITCLICEAVMKALDDTLVDTTNEQAVADFLSVICSYLGDLGSLETMCIEFITEYTDDIIEMLVGQYLEPEKVCTTIMACP